MRETGRTNGTSRAHKARVVIVEDEAIVRRDIESTLIAQAYDVVGTCDSGEAAIDLVLDQRPDVVLLDIVLKGLINGIEAARAIHEVSDIPVIFLTANTDQGTVSKARETLPYGYISKPFKQVDLLAAIEMTVHNHREDLRVRRERDELAGMLNGDDGSVLFVKHKGMMVGIRTSEIHFVEALKDYVGIHLHDKRYVIHSTLNDMEHRLPVGRFMRVHRSFIVRLDRIKEIDHTDIVLEKNDTRVPIGGLYQAKLRERLAVV